MPRPGRTAWSVPNRRPLSETAPPEPESAPANSLPQPVASPDDGPAIDAEPGLAAAPASDVPEVPEAAPPPAAPPDDRKPVAEGRQQVLAAFARNRTPPSPQPAPPQPRPVVRQVEPAEFEMTEEAWEELIAGFVAGNVNWNMRRLGGEPGSQDCRAPRSVLRRFGL
jgi:hypothetical protein